MADLIDRDAFMAEHRFAEKCENCKRDGWHCDNEMYSARDICVWLEDAPTVDVVSVQRGRWDIIISKHPVDRWQADIQCPICQYEKKYIWAGYFPCFDDNQARSITNTHAKNCKKPNFCENCGADMREGEKDG